MIGSSAVGHGWRGQRATPAGTAVVARLPSTPRPFHLPTAVATACGRVSQLAQPTFWLPAAPALAAPGFNPLPSALLIHPHQPPHPPKHAAARCPLCRSMHAH